MRLLTLFTMMALAGCAASQLSKPGGTPEMLAQDRALCAGKAEAAYPINPKMMSSGWDTPPRRECSGPPGATSCVNVPGVEAPPRMMDANEATRRKATEMCLKALGWS